ncbi:MAG: tetratricopeptide repeat protein [Planctomycetaceae bacterium]
MTADNHKIAQGCWKTANEALSREQFDYAVEMLFKAMLMAPDNLMFRQALRGAARKMYGDNRKGAKMAGMKLMAPKGKIKKAKLTKDWKAVNLTAEEALKINPWDAGLNASVGEACRNLGFSQVALFGYETALKVEPENKIYNREYALLQAERGNYNEAISAWVRIAKIDPDDEEAGRMITQLQANTVMRGGGYDEAKSTHEVKKTAYDDFRKSAQQGPQTADGPGMDAEADLQRAIRKDPADTGNYLKLADIYKRSKRLAEAAETLQQALEISGGGDPTIREQQEDVELELMRHNHDLAKQAFAANRQDETARQNVVALGQEILLREIEVMSARVERYPRDSRLKFDLARKHMQTKGYSKAIPLLQQAGADSRIECDVLVSLGDCFFHEKKDQLALRQFEKAKGVVNVHDSADLFKKIHYALGFLYAKRGEKSKAEEHYQEVLGVDYEYRDTLKRLEDLQSDGG